MMFKKLTKILIAGGLLLVASVGMQSCLKSDIVDYDDWRAQNDAWLDSFDFTGYERVSPDWAPLNDVYIKWHNDRSLTADSLVALSTSTVDITYELEDIEGNSLGNSFARTDSIYRSVPNQNIMGMWIALTTMHVGDSATLVIPYLSGYGSAIRGNVKPFSNLIYRVKVKKIQAFEKAYE